MDKRAQAQRLLAELGETLKLDKLTLDESTDSCALLFDDKRLLEIEFEKDSGRLVLNCALGELPPGDAEPLLRELLVADLYWHRTRGATLGVDEHSGQVMLTQAQGVVELDRQAFEALVETFLNEADRWSSRIAAKPSSADGAAASATLGDRGAPVIFG